MFGLEKIYIIFLLMQRKTLNSGPHFRFSSVSLFPQANSPSSNSIFPLLVLTCDKEAHLKHKLKGKMKHQLLAYSKIKNHPWLMLNRELNKRKLICCSNLAIFHSTSKSYVILHVILDGLALHWVEKCRMYIFHNSTLTLILYHKKWRE